MRGEQMIQNFQYEKSGYLNDKKNGNKSYILYSRFKISIDENSKRYGL